MLQVQLIQRLMGSAEARTLLGATPDGSSIAGSPNQVLQDSQASTISHVSDLRSKADRQTKPFCSIIACSPPWFRVGQPWRPELGSQERHQEGTHEELGREETPDFDLLTMPSRGNKFKSGRLGRQWRSIAKSIPPRLSLSGCSLEVTSTDSTLDCGLPKRRNTTTQRCLAGEAPKPYEESCCEGASEQ